MSDYTVVLFITFATLIVTSASVQWRYGNGLLTRLFRVIMTCICVIGTVGVVLGREGITPLSLTIVAIVCVSAVILMITVIQRTIIVRIQAQSDTVSRVVNNLAATSNQAAASAEEQATAVTQVSTAVEEIHQMSQSTANTSQEVVNVAGHAYAQGQQGLDSVREALLVMERVAQTTDFVDVVNHVAEQSNLLAFNAGIEAAKAEEYGRGFSVVASEVRNLAEQSKQAAKQIRDSIGYAESGQKAIQTTDSIITELGNVLKDATDKARQISGAALQQSAGIKQISDAMVNLIQNGKHTAMTARQIRDAAEELSNVTAQLALIIHGKTSRKADLF